MTTGEPKTVTPDEQGKERQTAQPRVATSTIHDDSCRCEEASRMTPRQLLGLMLSDLTFWKKPGPANPKKK